jgi:NAD+-dependent secondary alcohol dehydrogenase Adh1
MMRANSMRAARLHAYGSGKLRLEEVDEPSATAAHDVVVRIGGAGLCRTDLHIIEGRLRDAVGRLPRILGHENAGWVEEVGPAVSDIAVGDPVILHPLATCGRCLECRAGNDMHCADQSFPGLTADGGFAELVKTNHRAIVAVPSGVDPADVAPLADAGLAAIHAVKRVSANLTPDASAVVIGAGGLGHLGVQCLKALTPVRVIVVDTSAHALELTREVGADDAVLADGRHVEAVRELTGGAAAAVLDFVGEDDSIAAGLALLRRGGVYAVIGYGGTFTVPAVELVASELTIVGNLVGTYTDLVDLLALAAARKVHIRTTAYPLDSLNDAIADLDAGRLSGRAVIVP